jgi:hypothetical protein
MGKFTKPADLAQLVAGAQAHDTDPAQGDGVRFSLSLDGPLLARIERARAAKGGMQRIVWIRAAIADALDAQGF